MYSLPKLTSLYLAAIIFSALATTTTFAHVDPGSPVALYGPAVIELRVQFRARFHVPYPEFHHDMDGFGFTPQSEVYTENVEARWSGTGFIITADGYLLTNAHIAGTEYYKRFGYLLDHAREITDLFIEDQVIVYEHYDSFLQSYYMYLVDYGNFTLDEEEVQVVFGGESYQASLIASGDPIGLRTSKDVALLKAEVPDEHLFPTLKLGDSEEVEVGDLITILGFPEDLSEHPGDLDVAQSVLGRIVDLKPMGEWSVFQTDADITFGYSGGPALNEKGEVIGVAAFGALSPLTKATANFLVPINTVDGLLEMASIENSRSIIDEHYESGLTHLSRGEYNLSMNEFSTVLNLNPAHAYAQHYLNLAKQGIGGDARYPTTQTAITHRTSQEVSVLVKTTTVTDYETKTKTLFSTLTLTEAPPYHYTTPLSVALIALIIIISSALILRLFKLNQRNRVNRGHSNHT